nr:hypothetical protein [Tanacetum cinerariifolium]
IVANLSIIKLDVQSGLPLAGEKMDTIIKGTCLELTYLELTPLSNSEWYKVLEDRELKEEALRNKAILEETIDDDDESSYEQRKRWNVYDDTNHDHEYEMDHEVNERQDLCSNTTHELSVSNKRRFEMIKYFFTDDEEYVVVKEDEYDDLTSTSRDAC